MQNPKEYQHANSMQSADVTVTLKDFPAEWKTNAKIIDIGCGDGSVTMNIWKKNIPGNFIKIVGSDKSQKCVDFAKNHYEGERVEFIKLDIEEELPNELKGRFDHVISSYTLHWVHRQEQAFSNIYELLAKDGNCLIIFLGYCDICEYYRKLSHTPKWGVALKNCETTFMSPYHDSQDPGTEIKSLMKKIGFWNINVKVQHKTFDFVGGVDEFRKLIKSVNPFDGLKDKWEDFLDDYIKLNPNAGSVVYQLMVVSGKK